MEYLMLVWGEGPWWVNILMVYLAAVLVRVLRSAPTIVVVARARHISGRNKGSYASQLFWYFAGYISATLLLGWLLLLYRPVSFFAEDSDEFVKEQINKP